MAKLYLLYKKQELAISLEKAWDFFSAPENLKVITPDYMGFEITSLFSSDSMYPGQVISYIVKPLFNIGIPWVTEITHVNPPSYFVDEQRFGPYKFWHHQHHFSIKDNRLIMEDIVHYALPFGVLGHILHKLVVRKKLQEIFDYREKKLKELFNS